MVGVAFVLGIGALTKSPNQMLSCGRPPALRRTKTRFLHIFSRHLTLLPYRGAVMMISESRHSLDLSIRHYKEPVAKFCTTTDGYGR